jgi:hypothetical protein
MATSVATRKAKPARWLAFAASPTFAVMAGIDAFSAPHVAMCAAGSGPLSIGSMTAMYLLMSLFHLSPWLTLASGRPQTRA